MGHDHFMPEDVKEKLNHLIHKVSRYAVDKIKKELVNLSKRTMDDDALSNTRDTEAPACSCKIRINYGIPCRHISTKG